MDAEHAEIHASLQKLIGLHRQLLETVRLEHDAIRDANLSAIEDSTRAKEALIAAIARVSSQSSGSLNWARTSWYTSSGTRLWLTSVTASVQASAARSRALYQGHSRHTPRE